MYSWQYAEINEQPFKKLVRPRGNPAGRKVIYAQEVGAFDIETTTVYTVERLEEVLQPDKDGGPRTRVKFHPHSFMYVWQYAINDNAYYGRTWDEFKAFLQIIKRKLPPGTKLLTYTHNLSYEYQFLSGEFDFTLEDVFATDPRKILKLQLTDFIEIRCSYFLSNMTLRKFLETEGVPVQKEEMDYHVKRYPWTPLTPEELSYCKADVVGLTQAVRQRALNYNDTWYTIPYTSTGYVRREARAVMRKERRHDAYTYDTFEIYNMLTRAFRGGNTHASRYWAAMGVIDKLCDSRDFSSWYPYIIVSHEFPSREFFKVPDELLAGDSVAYLEKLINEHYAVLFRLELHGVRLDIRQHVPYIPVDKCEVCRYGSIDNGRVMDAEDITIVLTDVDWKIIKSMYTWEDARITWLAYSQYAPLPAGYIKLTRSYYDKKTRLKGVDDYAYRRGKEHVNALFGLMAQAVLRMEIKMDEDGLLYEDYPDDARAQYEKNAKKCFMPYSWGVWLTAHARAGLQTAIDAVGEYFLYCDTDSVKYIAEGCDVDFDTLFPGDPVVSYDPKGRPHSMGVMEHDATYSAFRSLGAKKYAVIYADDQGDKAGQLEITVAGVGKIDGSKELQAKGGLTAFKPGLIFKTGGIDAVYNDLEDMEIEDGPRHLHVGRNVSLIEGQYTLGVSSTYQDLLDSITNARPVIDPFSVDDIDLPLF